MSKTKHLDAAIAIFKGTEEAKRAKRKAQVEIIVEANEDTYYIQVNGKVVESGVGSAKHAMHCAQTRAARVRTLGKTVSVTLAYEGQKSS